MNANHPTKAGKYYDQVGDVRNGQAPTTGSYITRTLLTGNEGEPDNYKLTIDGGEGNADWTTPRHRHNFEQVRYVLGGDFIIAKNEVLPAGWVAYFPESAYYGPQLKSANLSLLHLQYGGPSKIGYWSVAQRKKGYDDLIAKGGKFGDGVYTWFDEKGGRHNQDGAEAVWEQIFGRPIEYPVPRYRDLIIMNPDSFNWVRDPNTPGIARRSLGVFTERDIRIGFTRMEAGSSIRFGTEPAVEILFIKEGSLSHDDETYPSMTAFSTEADERPVTITAKDPTELFYVKLPTF